MILLFIKNQIMYIIYDPYLFKKFVYVLNLIAQSNYFSEAKTLVFS